MSSRIIQQMIRMFGPRIAAMLTPILGNIARVGAQRLAVAIPVVGMVILAPITIPTGFVLRTVEDSLKTQKTEEEKRLENLPLSDRRRD